MKALATQFLRFALLLLLLPFSAVGSQATATAQLSLSEWLARMSTNQRELSYQGLVAYQADGQLRSFKVQHRVHEGAEWESVEALDGSGDAPAGRRWLQFDHSLSCVHSAHQLLQHYLAANTAADDVEGSGIDSEESLASLYTVHGGSIARVAGREVVEIQVQPRDVYRFAYRLGLDRETGLLLSLDMLDAQANVLESFRYLQLLLEPASLPSGEAHAEAHTESVPKHASPMAIKRSAQALRNHAWAPTWLPAGFVLAARDIEAGAASPLSFTDGLASFSVFVEPLKAGAEAMQASMRQGPTLAYSQGLIKAEKAYQVTVVGEVPELTARQVAGSLRFQ